MKYRNIIRPSVFETNSSTTHVFSIQKNITQVTNIKLSNNNEIVLIGGYYRSGFELKTWLEKLNYLAIDANNNIKRISLLSECVSKHLNHDISLIFNIHDSYIDNKSKNKLWSEIENGEIDLENLIFNNNIFIKSI